MSTDKPRTPVGRFLRQTAHPIYRSLETKVHPLRYLFLEITQKCNLHCLHCGSDCSKKPLPNELSVKEWLQFINRLGGQYGKEKRPFIVITGGEPLCHPKLMPIIESLRRNRFPVGMVTNGYLLHKKNVQQLMEHPLTSMTISLDGLEASHDWLRGVTGSYKRALAGAILMAKHRPSIRFLDVVTCVNPRNLKELPEILNVLRDSGIRRWRLFNIFPKGRAKTNSDLMLSNDEQQEMFHWIRDTRANLAGEDFFLDLSCEGFLPPKLDRQLRDEPYFCRAGICIGSVLSDGAISACPNISRDLVQGNIRQDDLVDVWENKYQSFRQRNWMKRGACAECDHWRRCRGNSLHLWDFERREPMRCFLPSDEK